MLLTTEVKSEETWFGYLKTRLATVVAGLPQPVFAD